VRPCPRVCPQILNAEDDRLTLHIATLYGVSHQSRARRLLRVDQAQTIARLSNVVCKSRRKASRNLDGCRIGR